MKIKKNIKIVILLTSLILLNISSTSKANITKETLNKIETNFISNKNNKIIREKYKNNLLEFLLNAYNKKNTDTSLDICQKAIHYFPNDENIKKIVTGIYFEKAKAIVKNITDEKEKMQLDLAQEYLEKCQQISENPKQFDKALTDILVRKCDFFYQEKDFDKTQILLDEILKKDSNNSYALYRTGQILVERNELKKALTYWNKISDNTLFPNIKKQIEQVKKDINLQKNFKKISWRNFNFYTSQKYQRVSYSLRKKINQAYRKIGSDFNYYPKYNIAIILYPKKYYNKLGDNMYLTSGLYDGKIRLPLEDSVPENSLFRVLKHEYTHLVIRDLTSEKAPVWLNEGLAEYEAGVDNFRKKNLKQKVQDGKVYSLNLLNQIFEESQNKEKLYTAYTESFAIVDYIITKFNFYKILQMLKDFKKGYSTQEVLSKNLAKNQEEILSDVKTFIKKEY